MSEPIKEAIDYIKSEIEKHQKEFDKAGEKRTTQFHIYVMFWIEFEMEAFVHLNLLRTILVYLEEEKSSSAIYTNLLSLKDRIQEQILKNKVSFSTSQSENLFRIIEQDVKKGYIGKCDSPIIWVLRILNKQDGN